MTTTRDWSCLCLPICSVWMTMSWRRSCFCIGRSLKRPILMEHWRKSSFLPAMLFERICCHQMSSSEEGLWDSCQRSHSRAYWKTWWNQCRRIWHIDTFTFEEMLSCAYTTSSWTLEWSWWRTLSMRLNRLLWMRLTWAPKEMLSFSCSIWIKTRLSVISKQ